MLSTRVILYFLGVLYYQNVVGKKYHPCDIEDSNCLTQAAKKTYLECVKGSLKGVTPSDPIRLDLIEVNKPEIKFKVRNSTFTGMKTCSPELVRINPKSMMYDYHVACKHLVTVGQYQVTGQINSVPLEGEGDFRVDHYDYVLLFHGEYVYEKDKDEKLHILIKNYELDTEIRDKVVYDYKNLYYGDVEKSAAMHKYANENWKIMDKIISLPVMEKYMVSFIKNVNSYLKVAPVEHVFMNEA